MNLPLKNLKNGLMKINGKDVHRDSTCSSHMPIQMEFIKKFNPKSVLELGAGYYSTKLYLENCDKVVSIESDSDEWFNMMEEKFSSYKNWEHLKISGLEEICSYIKNRNEIFDVIFVDGDEFRSQETNFSFDYATTIIGHDTQHYFRDSYLVPREFYQIDFKNFDISYGHPAGHDHRPWTTMFTKDKNIANYFDNIEESLYESYKFPYIYDVCPNPNFSNL